MRARVIQHKDISLVMAIATAGVLVYTVMGVFIMHQQAQKQASLDAAPTIATNL